MHGAQQASWVSLGAPALQPCGQLRRLGGRAVGRSRMLQTCSQRSPAPIPAGPLGPTSSALSPHTRCSPGAPGPRGGRAPREGLEFFPGGAPSRRPSLALAFSGSLRVPLPAASQLRAPGAGKKPHAPARNAGPGGRGAGAGQGRAGQGRELPAGKVGERERAARALPGPPRRPCSRPVRRLGLTAALHTCPAGLADGTTRGLRGFGVPRWLGRGGSARPGQLPPPSVRPPSLLPRRRGQSIMFPHTPPSRRGLWGPGGEQGAD